MIAGAIEPQPTPPMKHPSTALCALLFSFTMTSAPLCAQDLATGKRFIETPTYSESDDTRVLEAFAGLRVADVSDGMDMAGLPDTGLVIPEIHPDWVDTETMSHVFRGIAVTVRYVPTQRVDRPEPGRDFSEWEGHFYGTYSHEAFFELIKPGTVVVIDDVEDKDIGTIGSNNILAWHKAGAVGVVTDASARDTDEVALQKVPLYLRKKGRGIRPGRNEIESVNLPVTIGGVLVVPGDVVVADGDGVIVVPRKVALEVAAHAHAVLKKDKAGRRALYEAMGRPLDSTVKD